MLGERRATRWTCRSVRTLVLTPRKWEENAECRSGGSIRGILVTTEASEVRDVLPDAWPFLVPPSKPPELAESMARLMELSVGERTVLGRSMISYVEQKFPEDEILAQWELLLTAVR